MTVHSRLVFVSEKPLPLQAFWPLQALAAVLQALCPLQALAPGHCTPADAEAATNVLAANTAAAVPTIMLLFMLSVLPVSHAIVIGVMQGL
jgi:hypothetical protein